MNTDNEQILRIITDNPQAGAVNMAADEAILKSVNSEESPATLRFYRWAAPTISLGYFQKHQELAQQNNVISRMPMVRRQTGGGAILHDDELTYSLILPLNGTIPSTDIEKMYKLVHDAFIDVLADLGIRATYRGGKDSANNQRGPFFCFARAHRLDLMIGNDKLLGSAQRRIKNAVLQHGSLILNRHHAQQPSAELAKAAKVPIDLDILTKNIATHIAANLKLKPVPAKLTGSEQKLAAELEDKYTSQQWNRQR